MSEPAPWPVPPRASASSTHPRAGGAGGGAGACRSRRRSDQDRAARAGDETRTFPPIRDGESHYSSASTAARRAFVVDLKSEAGVALVKDLAAKCDVVIENYRPGVMDRLGLGYEVLSAINRG